MVGKPIQVVPLADVATECAHTKTYRFRAEMRPRPGQFLMVWIPRQNELPMAYSYVGEPLGMTVRAYGEATRALAAEWLYAWTRNPMVLSALAFLIAVGLWLRSTLFVLWVIAVITPAVLVFLKVYEERELEIRFGEAYREYREKTPMLWPRRPEKPRNEFRG